MDIAEAYERRRLANLWSEAERKHLDPNDGIPAVLARFPALEGWEEIRSLPSGRAEDQIRYAVLIAAGNYNHELVRLCLARAIDVADMGAHDARWNTCWSETRQVEHGKLSSVGILARAWTSDEGPEIDALRESADEITKGALEERPRWSEMAQSEYLYGIQLKLCAEDVEDAWRMLSIRKAFSRMPRYYDWHRRLVELLRSSAPKSALQPHYDVYFDELRDPSLNPPANDSDEENLPGIALIRLRLALIRWIYIERKPIAGNWRHIIGQIGY